MEVKQVGGDSDDLYGLMLEDVDPEKYEKIKELEKRYSYQVPSLDKIQIEVQVAKEAAKSTNFKVYFAVEKL
jgi:hypothetical protein